MEWCGESPFFCTWGSMDLTELQRNMVYHGMEIPFASPLLFYDVQKLYSQISTLLREKGLLVEKLLGQCLETLKQRKPDIVLITGDMTHGSGGLQDGVVH